MNDYDVCIVQIGSRPFSTDVLRDMAKAPLLVHRAYPGAEITLTVDGFDDDPRSLWDIPEAAAYVRDYARASGLAEWRSPMFRALDATTKALLIKCRAIAEPHPYRVEIRE